MARSIISQLAKQMVEINSRLGNKGDGLTQMCIRTKKDCVQLREMTMRPDFGEPSTKLFKTFKNYDELLPFIETFNLGLKWGGLKLG